VAQHGALLGATGAHPATCRHVRELFTSYVPSIARSRMRVRVMLSAVVTDAPRCQC